MIYVLNYIYLTQQQGCVRSVYIKSTAVSRRASQNTQTLQRLGYSSRQPCRSTCCQLKSRQWGYTGHIMAKSVQLKKCFVYLISDMQIAQSVFGLNSMNSWIHPIWCCVVLFVNDSFKRTNLFGKQTELNHFLKQSIFSQFSWARNQLRADVRGYTPSQSEWFKSIACRRNGVCCRQQIHSWFRLLTFSCNDSKTLVLDCNPNTWHYYIIMHRLTLTVTACSAMLAHVRTRLKSRK